MTAPHPAATSPSAKAAFAGQVEELHLAVRRFIGARVSNPAVADDLTQDVFAKVLRQLPRLRDPSRIVGWIFQIARNAIADHFRRFRPTETLDNNAGSSTSEHETYDREEQRLRSALNAYVRSVVDSLPPPYREAIVLTEYEGISQVELARRIGLSVSAAKSRVQRARHMVRTTIEACCHFKFDRYGTVVDCTPRENECGCDGAIGGANPAD